MSDANFRELFIEVPFRGQITKAHVLVYGSDSLKNQILCLHGIGSRAKEPFSVVAPILAKDFQILALDWIGCGETSRLLGPEDSYSSDYCSEWLREFILTSIKANLLHSPFSVFAISMSAIAIPKIWSGIGKFISKIVFVNPLGMDTHINKAFAFILTSPWISHKKIPNFILSRFIWRRIFHLPEWSRVRLKTEIKNGEFEVLIRYAKAGILPKGRLMDLNFVPEKFEKIQAPILLLASSHDPIFYRRDYLKFARSRKNWKIVEIDFNGHNFMRAKAKEVSGEVVKFLSGEDK